MGVPLVFRVAGAAHSSLVSGSESFNPGGDPALDAPWHEEKRG